MLKLTTKSETWPIQGGFTISRGTKTSAEVVVVEIFDGHYKGRGECVPYAHYGETVDSVLALIRSLEADIMQGMDRKQLQQRLPAGAARNAVDCAFWDLQAKKTNCRAWELAGISTLEALTTAYTLSLDTPENMYKVAVENAHRPLLKLKLAGQEDSERVQAVRKGAPDARLIVDANEGWTTEIYQQLIPKLVALGVEMIEQPLPAGKDEALRTLNRPIPICADESCHERASLDDLLGKYDMINIKLDKTGGLTEAMALRQQAEVEGLQIMVGCMLATSLAMAPALVVAQDAAIVDLDGPLLLDKDRDDGLKFEQGFVYPPQSALWG